MSDENNSPVDHAFPATRWSLISDLNREPELALEHICQAYWRPIYGFLRMQGHRPLDAEDITQNFLAKLSNGETLKKADRHRGKLRSFLLGALKRHLVDHQRELNAQKRGGHTVTLSLNVEEGERFFNKLPSNDSTPDEDFDRAWVLDLIERVQSRIESEYQAANKLQEFHTLRPALTGTREIDSERVARELGIAHSTVRVLAHRLRKNFRALLQAEIRDTLGPGGDLKKEMHALLEIMSRNK